MRSSFIPLSKETAILLIKLHENNFSIKGLNSSEQNNLEQFEKLLDDAIEKISSTKKAFIRLSTRSPKDSKKARNKRLEKYKDELSSTGVNAENRKTYVLLKSYLYGLKVSTGLEALELLCDSERVYDDISDAIENQDPFSMKVGIREWIGIPFEMEFRGFVKNKQLNALTQYYHYIYFKDIQGRQDILAHKIQSFFEEIKDKIWLDDFVIDFVILSVKVLLLELNPFVPGTEAKLFSWKNESDIIENGPFEMRIKTSPINH